MIEPEKSRREIAADLRRLADLYERVLGARLPLLPVQLRRIAARLEECIR